MNGLPGLTEENTVPGHQRVANTDGHKNNESYKVPAATGKGNSSYMHPQVEKLSMTQPWQTVDKTLAESGRPLEQLGRSKTVFPVTTEKVRGAPKPSKAPGMKSGGAIPGPVKPSIS